LGSDLEDARDVAFRIMANIKRVIVGQDDAVRLVVMALLAKGHVLVEGAPGVGKTMFARSLARSVDGAFKRIQCTSDLLPTDVTGTYVFDQRDRDFHFRPGPIMSQFVLVDEINRAPPRTQSAFLECLEERQVTVDGVTHPVPEPFQLIATRNPHQHVGTFPLPETELDRFLVSVRLDYPAPADEVAIVERQLAVHPIEELAPVVEAANLLRAQTALRGLFIDRLVIEYIVAVVNAVRSHPQVSGGPSPRSTMALTHLARANALIEGRDFATPDDVKAVATRALAHRVSVGQRAQTGGSAEDVVRQVLLSVPVEESSRQASGSASPRD
jgi:MoxR-like ATPase